MKAFSLQFCDHKTAQSTPKQKLRYKNPFQQAKHKSAMPLPALMLPLQLQGKRPLNTPSEFIL